MKIHPLMFVTQWFMTLYTGLPCWDTVLCIWDMILFEGNETHLLHENEFADVLSLILGLCI